MGHSTAWRHFHPSQPTSGVQKYRATTLGTERTVPAFVCKFRNFVTRHRIISVQVKASWFSAVRSVAEYPGTACRGMIADLPPSVWRSSQCRVEPDHAATTSFFPRKRASQSRPTAAKVSYHEGNARSAVAGLTFWNHDVRFSSLSTQRPYEILKGQTAIPDSRHRRKKQPDFQQGDEAKNERFWVSAKDHHHLFRS